MNRTSLAHRLVGFACMATLTATVFTSCKKEETPVDPVPTPQSTTYSFPLTIGSYWIYQEEQTDSAGNITSIDAIDSVYISSDTIINGDQYFKVVTAGTGVWWQLNLQPQFVRDSAGYIVHSDGKFIEHDNFTDTLDYNDFGGAINAWYFMRHEDSSVTVPAGTFTTIDYEGHMYSTDPNYQWPVPRYTHQIFANGIGKIMEVSYYYSQPGYLQRRLLRYHIQ